MGTVTVQCTRCGLALAPPIRVGGMEPLPTWTAEELSGPCIDPRDGAYLPDHPAMRARVTIPGQPSVTRLFE